MGRILGIRWEPAVRLWVADVLMEQGGVIHVGAPRDVTLPTSMSVQALDRIVITICR